MLVDGASPRDEVTMLFRCFAGSRSNRTGGSPRGSTRGVDEVEATCCPHRKLYSSPTLLREPAERLRVQRGGSALAGTAPPF
jgi:hypothetical protein